MKQITFNLPNQFPLILKQNIITGYVYDTLTSTNSQAWQLLDEKLSPPFVVIAKEQTSGKGQRGNIWRSNLGGLYLSMALDFHCSIEFINDLILWSVYGIAGGLNKLNIPVKIKWLNDLILAEKKLGGILCETKIEKNHIKKIVIGVGINYQNTYPEYGISLNDFFQNSCENPINSLQELATICSIELLNAYKIYLDLGRENIVNNYNQLLYNRGENIVISEKMQGKIFGINPQGNLEIKLTSSGAKTKINLSPQDYRLSYQKNEHNFYTLTEK